MQCISSCVLTNESLFLSYSHPVHNDYLPEVVQGEVFLKKEGDISDKSWDEAALQVWELEENNGKAWEGRASGGLYHKM